LQQHGGGKRIDISFAVTRRTAHLANRAKRGGGGEPLVEQLYGQTGSSLQFLGEASHVGGALRVVSILVKRQSNYEAPRIERGCASDELSYWWTLAGSALNETGRRSDDAQRVADRKSDPSLAIIDGQESRAVTPHSRNLPAPLRPSG
jgi:hypothetical protein